MTKFYIEYNPYTLKYTFLKNGRPINEHSRIQEKSNQRIQAVLDPGKDNWDGLAKEIQKACNDNDIEITFRGRKIDFDDLQSYFLDYEGANYSLVFEEAGKDRDIMSHLEDVIAEIKKSGIEEFNQENASGETIFDVYEKMKENVFIINVIATMSSGKSTLINAILGTELLPSKNEACTATVASILDKDEMKGAGFWAECYADDWETVVYPKKQITLEDLENYNDDEKVTYINIEGDIPGISSAKINLLLQDTPGPNNSRNKEHGELTREIINDKNAVVLYVMNATQFAVDDDEELLHLISEQMKKYGKEARDRFIFVLNKCDALDEEKGETVERLLDSVREYLWKDFKIADPVLIPVSARTALVARKNLYGEQLTRNEKHTLADLEDFVEIPELHYEDYAKLTPTVRKNLKDQIEVSHTDEDGAAKEAIIHTGVPAVEATIDEYIEKYAYPMKFSDAIQDLDKILDDIDMKTSFHAQIDQDERKQKEIQKQIEEAKAQEASSEDIITEFSERVDELQIDPGEERAKKIEIEKRIEQVSIKYLNIGKIDEAEAESQIHSFNEDLQKIDVTCRDNLNAFFTETVYAEGEKMLSQYKSAVESVLNGINISGYEFDKDIEIRKVKIDNLESIISKHRSDRMEEKIGWMDNPKRRGFLGRFKFWQPKKVSYTYSVKDGNDIDVSSVIMEIMGPYRNQMEENIKAMYDAAKDNLEAYKKFFKESLQEVQDKVKEIIAQIERDTSNMEELRKIVAVEKEKAEYAEKIRDEIDSVTNF